MTSSGAPVALLACGAVARDVADLVERRGWRADVHGISSDLHMTPLEIAPAVDRRLRDLTKRYERVVVVYGDCGTGGRLDEVLARYPAVRPAGVHCFEWYSADLYRRFHEDIGIYFLTDWLVDHWDRAVIKGLGLDRFPWLKETYFGNLSRILFVRQHPDPGREAQAREIAGWIDRPLEIHDLGPGPLEALLAPLVEEGAGARPSSPGGGRGGPIPRGRMGPMESWIDQLARAFGDEPLSQAQVNELLGVARDVAHRVERRITPLSTFLLGQEIGRRVAGGATREEALAAALETLRSQLPDVALQAED